ncbi:MAG: HEAT repeat domain-containing protein, partial [Candidatus Coatesbacteria bacterium]|nr:HEAT repeat domain-containing protein [Candidatus Coatesbacteria bacterium]
MKREYRRLAKFIFCFGVLVALLFSTAIAFRFFSTVNLAHPYEWQRQLSAGLSLAMMGREGDAIVGHPIREVWAHALAGEYEVLKDIYLNSVVQNSRPIFDQEKRGFVNLPEPIDSKMARFKRFACVEALFAIADDRAMDTLLQMLREEPIPSYAIIESILSDGRQEKIDSLLELVGEGDQRLENTISAVLRFSDSVKKGPAIVDLSCKLLESEDGQTFCFAIEGLKKAVESDPELREKAEECLRASLRECSDEDIATARRVQLADFLGKGSAEAQQIIRNLIAEDPNPPHGVGYYHIHLLPEDEALGLIRELAASEDEDSRFTAAHSAARIASPEAARITELLSRDNSRKVRAMLAGSLLTPFEGREEMLLRLACDSEYMVRNACMIPLSDLHTEASQQMLIDLVWTEYYLNEAKVKGWDYYEAIPPESFTPEFMRSNLPDLASSRRAELRRLAASYLEYHPPDG